MNQYRLNGPQPGLVPRLIAGLVGTVAVVGAFFVGLVAWILLAGFLLIGALVASIWFWRQRRRFQKSARANDDAFIEVEYEVLDEKEPRV